MSWVKNVIFARDKQIRNAIIVDPINVVYLFLVRPLGHWAKDYRKKPNKCNGFRNVIVGRRIARAIEHTFSSIISCLSREIIKIIDTNFYRTLTIKSSKLDDSVDQSNKSKSRDGLIKREVNRISDRTCYFSFRRDMVRKW